MHSQPLLPLSPTHDTPSRYCPLTNSQHSQLLLPLSQLTTLPAATAPLPNSRRPFRSASQATTTASRRTAPTWPSGENAAATSRLSCPLRPSRNSWAVVQPATACPEQDLVMMIWPDRQTSLQSRACRRGRDPPFPRWMSPRVQYNHCSSTARTCYVRGFGFLVARISHFALLISVYCISGQWLSLVIPLSLACPAYRTDICDICEPIDYRATVHWHVLE